MISRLCTYRVRCDTEGCTVEIIVQTCFRMEGQAFDVKGWSVETEYGRGGSSHYHLCPVCTKNRLHAPQEPPMQVGSRG